MDTATLKRFGLLPPINLQQNLLDQAWSLLASHRISRKGLLDFSNGRYYFFCIRGCYPDTDKQFFPLKHVWIMCGSDPNQKLCEEELEDHGISFVLFQENNLTQLSIVSSQFEGDTSLDLAESITQDEMRRILSQLVSSKRVS